MHLSVIAAVLMLLIAANYWLDRYSILTKHEARQKFAGASFTDVHAVIPSKAILAGIAIFVAVLFIVTAVRGNWRLPAIGVGLMVVAAIAVGGIYPAVVQRFQVQPNQQDAEAEYIQRNIDATLDAYGLDDVEKTDYDAKVTAEAGALRADAETTASIRLLDPQIVSPSFKQLAADPRVLRLPGLAVGRPVHDRRREPRHRDRRARARPRAASTPQQRNWTNDTTVYTHGFGVVAAYGNTTAARGAPAFWEGGIPSHGRRWASTSRASTSARSRPTYSIVGAPEGTKPWELDYPDDASGGAVNSTLPDADGRPPARRSATRSNKLLYALKFGSEQILFSDRVTERLADPLRPRPARARRRRSRRT